MSRARVLFLGPADSLVLAYLREEEEVTQASGHPSELEDAVRQSDFIVSHGYRYILPPEILRAFPDSAVNCHISYLPWNRGADPNFWSWLDGTPRGVTVHYMDAGVDTGDVVAKRVVDFGPTFDEETLATSYRRLQVELADLFREAWAAIRERRCKRVPQHQEGSYHPSREKELFTHLLKDGWDTSVAKLVYPPSRFAPLPSRGDRSVNPSRERSA